MITLQGQASISLTFLPRISQAGECFRNSDTILATTLVFTPDVVLAVHEPAARLAGTIV